MDNLSKIWVESINNENIITDLRMWILFSTLFNVKNLKISKHTRCQVSNKKKLRKI